jgi:hypothetical protein
MCTKLALFTRSRTIRANEIASDRLSKCATWYTEKEIEIGSFKMAFEIYFYAF